MLKIVCMSLCVLVLCHCYVTPRQSVKSSKYFHHLRFSYASEKETWSETYEFCNGTQQSPIALDICDNLVLPALTFSGHYDLRPEGFVLSNTGHSAQVTYQGTPPSLSGGPLNGDYVLEQAHFHWGEEDEGSEHDIGAVFYGMEVHLVHYKTDYGSFDNALNFTDGVAVVALMLDAADFDNVDLNSLVFNLFLIRELEAVAAIPADSMAWLAQYLTSTGSYYTYFGSLTTPPCNEVVTWAVLTKRSSIGRQQLAQFRFLLGHDGPILQNRRQLQPLNSRSVFCAS